MQSAAMHKNEIPNCSKFTRRDKLESIEYLLMLSRMVICNCVYSYTELLQVFVLCSNFIAMFAILLQYY